MMERASRGGYTHEVSYGEIPCWVTVGGWPLGGVGRVDVLLFCLQETRLRIQ
jgi:hypothetical protein